MDAALTGTTLTLEDVLVYTNSRRTVEELDRFAARSGDPLLTTVVRSKINFLRGAVKVAAEGFRMAIARKPDSAALHFELGVCEYNKASYGESLAAFTRVTELDPGFVVAWYWIGNCRMARMEMAEALAAFRKMAGMGPEWFLAQYRCGECHASLGETDQAIACFERVVAGNRGNVMAHYHLGKLLVRKGRTLEAQEVYRRGLAVNPEAEPLRRALEYLRGGDNP